jgi:hypothetical protein
MILVHEVLLYVHSALNVGSGVTAKHRNWARGIYDDLKSLKSWILVAALADVLQILRVGNVSLQRGSLYLNDVERIVSKTRVDIADYRQGIRSCLDLLVLTRPVVAAHASHLYKACNHILVKRHAQGSMVASAILKGGIVRFTFPFGLCQSRYASNTSNPNAPPNI